jgi:hypothetical protein
MKFTAVIFFILGLSLATATTCSLPNYFVFPNGACGGCPPGGTNPANGVDLTSCMCNTVSNYTGAWNSVDLRCQCAAGYYLDGSALRCLQCGLNNEGTAETGSNLASCKCKLGYAYSVVSRGAPCDNCAAGYFARSLSPLTCSLCEAGNYCTGKLNDPVRCPATSPNSTSGASELKQCTSNSSLRVYIAFSGVISILLMIFI